MYKTGTNMVNPYDDFIIKTKARYKMGDIDALELATLEWGAWFNHHRLLEPIGYIPPAEAEANYWRQLALSDSSTEVST